MKKFIQIALHIILLLGVLFYFQGCQKEEIENIDQSNSNSEIKINNVTINELKSKSVISKSLKILNEKFDINTSKDITSNDGSFVLVTDRIYQVEGEFETTYSFKIKFPTDPLSDFENFVLIQKQDGKVEYYIYKYRFNKDLSDEFPFEVNYIKVDETQIKIEDFSDVNKYLYYNGSCLLDIFLFPSSGYMATGFNVVWCDTWGSGNDTSDDSEGSSGTDSTPEDTSSSTNDLGDPYPTGGGSGSTTTATTESTPIATNIAYEENVINALIYSNNFTFDNQRWVSEHPIESKQLSIFLLGNNNSVDAKNFVGQFIKQTEITNLSFDINRSYKSPVNINLTSIDPNTPEGKLFLCIYDKLTQSASFKELFLNTFTQDDRINVCMQIGDTPGANGTCQLTIVPDGSGTFYNNTITINSSILNGTRSNFEIAKTIIHEFIHAYLNNVNYGCANYFTIPVLNSLDLPNLIDEFYQQGCTVNQYTSHEFMFDHMLPAFEAVFSEIGNLLNSQSGLDYAIANQVYDNSTYVENFNLQNFYYYLSMMGLHESTAFQDEITNDPYQKFLYDSYSYTARYSMTKSCN